MDNYCPDCRFPKVVVLFLAEIVGTFILEFVGCMGLCVKVADHIPVVPHISALGFGLAVMMAIEAVGHISDAHINPQISIAAMILGRLSPIYTLVYILAQFIGATLGYGLVTLLIPAEFSKGTCLTFPHPVVTVTQAVFIEVAITFILILILGAIGDERKANRLDSLPLRFGLAVAGLCMVSSPFTAASMNTARSFAPALINNKWDHHWIYWVGPTIGSVCAAFFYKFVLEPPVE